MAVIPVCWSWTMMASRLWWSSVEFWLGWWWWSKLGAQQFLHRPGLITLPPIFFDVRIECGEIDYFWCPPPRQLHIGLSHFGPVVVAAKKRIFCLFLLIIPLVKLGVGFFFVIVDWKIGLYQLSIIILCDTFDGAVILNYTNRIMKSRYWALRLLVLIQA